MTTESPRRFLKTATLLLTGGALLEAASCAEGTSEIFANAVLGLASSIVNTFLSLYIADLFGTGSTFSF